MESDHRAVKETVKIDIKSARIIIIKKKKKIESIRPYYRKIL